jgi:DNA-binding beta-propeller fold protein YncE
MKRPGSRICLVAVISLLLGVIWHNAAGAAVAPTFVPLGEIREGLTTPGRIDADAAGNIYVTDARKSTVFKFDKYGKLARAFTGASVSGAGLAVTPDGSRIYAAGINAVSILDGVTGAVLGRLGKGIGEFSFAGEIDLDAGGRVFVADTGAMVVRVYDAGGAFLYQFGGFYSGSGSWAGLFRSIWALSIDVAAGEVYVADVMTAGTSYPKIQVFDLAGNLKRSLLATTGFGTPAMTFFGGPTFDEAGRGYFPDSYKNHIRTLGLPTTYLSTYGVTGYEMGQLQGPIDAVYDPSTKRLFLTCDGARIEIFGIDGGTNPAKANVPPGLPVPLSPIADGEVASATPELLFRNAVDADGNALTYQVKLLKGGAVVAEYAGLPEGTGTSSVQVASVLEENSRYFWAVQAFDGEEVSGWSALQSFYVNAVQEPPTAPALVAPEADALLDGQGLFSWQTSVDSDPFDTVGYVLEIAADPAFTEPLVQQAVAGTSAELATLAGYADLEDGAAYFWRVKAVDNHGLVSEPSAIRPFAYDTTLLKITANVPGARVYLGGNYGYVGRYVGEAPVELRDVPAGPCSVVVERAGFEPFIAQVRPAERENLSVYAVLTPAILPADLKARPLSAAGAAIALGGDAAPFAVDFDNDGLIDLVTGDASGELRLFRGEATADGKFSFTAAVGLGLPLVPGCTPFVADWDNDGRKDLLVGAADGTVLLYLNTGSEDAPSFGAGALLQAGGTPIAVGAAAAPAVIDLDGDGDKDLLVGSASGALVRLRNDGTDEAPQLVAAGNLVTLSSPVAPYLADWDGDGARELLLAAGEHLYVYKRQAGGAYAAQTVLSVGADLTGKNGKAGGGAYSLGSRLRLCAFDYDGKKGKDLIVGNAAGDVRLAFSNGSQYAPAFAAALLDKVAQIDGMLSESAPELSAQLAGVGAAIQAGNLALAAEQTGLLLAAVPGGTELAQALTELSDLLQ